MVEVNEEYLPTNLRAVMDADLPKMIVMLIDRSRTQEEQIRRLAERVFELEPHDE